MDACIYKAASRRTCAGCVPVVYLFDKNESKSTCQEVDGHCIVEDSYPGLLLISWEPAGSQIFGTVTTEDSKTIEHIFLQRFVTLAKWIM